MYPQKFNTLELNEKFQPLGSLPDRCRKANHYWKRYGRKFIVIGEGVNSHICRIR